MALCNSRNPNLLSRSPLLLHFQISIFFLILLSLIPSANSMFFNFSSFDKNPKDIRLEGSASISGQVIQVTGYPPSRNRVGRASYRKAVHIWDKSTGNLTDFNTHFSFIINSNQYIFGDGLAFYFASEDSTLNLNSTGGFLGLVDSTEDQIFALAMDTASQEWKPSNQFGLINNSSIKSQVCVPWDETGVLGGRKANAWVSYNSSTKNLSIFLTYAENPVFRGNSTFSYTVDLRDKLPEWVSVGFSAATGSITQSYIVLNWEFSSNLEMGHGSKNKKLEVGLSVGGGVLIGFIGLALFFLWKNLNRGGEDHDVILDETFDDEFEKETGPRRFLYGELVRATNDFAEERKLGEGGFGSVYRGFLSDVNMDVAVKRVSKTSKQGMKEFMSEVKTINRLRHRNLVQIVGWCHQGDELLLVYDFMPKGSLDFHLFGGESSLTWEMRYKIALGLASALLYLHEEGDQCVIHRDIKSSNVMLDSNFNSKLGDFGLARLIDHEKAWKTTVLAGTRGYMAPECATTWKSTKESDVYSFGIVALEIACGRRPVDLSAEESMEMLVEWVWILYGKRKLLEAADVRLDMDFNEQQMECLMVVGLWCAHPDYKLRPSIKQVLQVLNFEASLPILSFKMPETTYSAPPFMTMGTDSTVSSAPSLSITDFERGRP